MDYLLNISINITITSIAYIALIGLLWGDFMGMFVVRTERSVNLMSQGIEPKKTGLKLYGGRSSCMHCQEIIPWYYNIPLLGWAHLRGRSGCCSKPISAIYPITECVFMIAFPASFYFLSPFAAAIFLAALSVCYVATYVDLKTMHLPIEGNYLILMISFMVLATYSPDPADKVIYAIIAWILLHVINGLSPQEVIGEGDIPIIVSIILISFSYLFNVALIVASFVTIGIFSYNFIKHKNYSLARMVPFGPGLCTAYLFALIVVLKETPFA